jgi:hydrogenase maturation factor
MPLSVGKLPPDLLARLLAQTPVTDPRVLVRPGPGLDCAVIAPAAGEMLLVAKTDPITFATDQIGWYLVQVNANDLATTGATPRWMLVTMLLPEATTTPELVDQISAQIHTACSAIGVSVVGGHTEITAGLARPILCGTLLGEVPRDQLVTPRGARPGDRLLLTKGVPVEATALLAREFPDRLKPALTTAEVEAARQYLYAPGLSALRDAQTARRAGRVTAMHDPTEGGLAAALWELAEASGLALVVDVSAVPVPALSARVCAAFGVDPLAAIASGALLLTVDPQDATAIVQALVQEGILCAEIGRVQTGSAEVRAGLHLDAPLLTRPARDEIARLYEAVGKDISSQRG